MSKYVAKLTQEGQRYMIDLCAGHDKFGAIREIAIKLQKSDVAITAVDLCRKILNPAGFKTDLGTEYTGNRRGPCAVVRAAYDHFAGTEPLVAKAIAEAFTAMDGLPAYDR